MPTGQQATQLAADYLAAQHGGHASFCWLEVADADTRAVGRPQLWYRVGGKKTGSAYKFYCGGTARVVPPPHAGATLGSANPHTHHCCMLVQLAAISLGR